MTTDQNCYGLPCNTVATTVYSPSRIVTDPGLDQIRGTGDDRSLTFFDVLPGRTLARTRSCTPTAATTSRSTACRATRRSNSRSASGCRTAGRCRGSYVWSRLDGSQLGLTTNGTGRVNYDYTNPNNLIDFVGQGRGANDQPQAFKLLGSYQAPWDINIGANFQALSGLPIR
jgi:hypothetical protein